MSAEATVRDYYEALRRGDPLPPYFAGTGGEPDGGTGEDAGGRESGAPVVKYGIGERLVGYAEVAAGLREQTRTTADWTVESAALRVTERAEHAWFSDEVRMAWTDLDADRERTFETRWSGTLERRDGAWRFVGMHVSTPRRIGADGERDTTRATGRDDPGRA
ncbi:MAG: nuclear transport factor 2 family protein [Haloferacaceae archaeon]